MRGCLIIINYNGMRYLPNYLADIISASFEESIDVIVTDDLSTDGSIAYLSGQECSYTVNNGQNHGFAANVNNGIRYACNKAEYDYFIIANNDIRFYSGFTKEMRETVEQLIASDNEIGLIGFKECIFNESNFEEVLLANNDASSALEEVNELPGFFFIIIRKALDKVGYLDEDYFMYGEDNDYFTRVRKAGLKLINTGLPVFHLSEGSSVNAKNTSWYVYRNILLFAQKNGGIRAMPIAVLRLLKHMWNPLNNNQHPSVQRIKRSGFLQNHYLLLKSIGWNIRYYIKRRFRS